MSLSQQQTEELSKYQEKFLNNEISHEMYEIAKKDILSWNIPKSNDSLIKKIRVESAEPEKDFIYYFIIFIGGLAMFLKNILKGIWKGISFIGRAIHRVLISFAHKKNFSIKKLYLIFGVVIFLVIGGIVGTSQILASINENQRIESNKRLTEERRIEEQEASEKRMAEQKQIEAEKANTPKPSITLLSSTGSQGKKTEYSLRFSLTGADTVTVNSEVLQSIGSGIYEKSFTIQEGETSITIFSKNKYFSDTISLIVSREKTDTEIQAEKDAEAKELAEQKEAERIAKEEERRVEEEKRQALETEKKTYTAILYAKLSKNPDKYKGERIKFKGKIFSADEEGTNSAFQINTDGYGYGDQIITLATWSNDYVEGNWVTVWGVVIGEQCYTSQAGWDICVPSVKANIIE